MISLPQKIKLIGKNKVAVVPSQRETQTESGLYLSTLNTVHDYKRMIVVEISDDVDSLKNGDEVLVNMAKAKKSTLAGWSEELQAKFSIDIHLVDEYEVLAVYED
jgi:co-chaperonin GroES (HSP10)